MKAWFALLLLAGAAAGCADGGGGGNPNLAAPKWVVHARPGDDRATVFVHSAFREQAYDWIHVRVDNLTISNRTFAFSSEERVASMGFFLDITVGTETQQYRSRARIDLVAEDKDALVSWFDAEKVEFAEPREFGLPFEHVLDRYKVEP